MTESQRNLKEHFLEPEVRDGVEVSRELKAVWKVMLDMFEEFVRICDKYDLHYCMDGGSLLGTIRHKGFIPWDDDMDVSLPRADFQRFLEVAPKELKHPYFMQYTTTDHEHTQAYACLRNVDTAGIDVGWTRDRRRFCMGIGIDIFPIDYIPDEVRVRKMLQRNKNFARVIGHAYNRQIPSLKKFIAHWGAKFIVCVVGINRIVRLRDLNFGAYGKDECERCSNIAFNVGKERAIWPKGIYDSRMKVPFEYLDVYVPVGYEFYLDKVYGSDWRTPIRGRGDHETLVSDTSRSYKEILVERFGYNKCEIAKLP